MVSQASPSRTSKLVVVAFDLPDQSSHFFDELLGYRSAAEELGISATFLVPRKANPFFVKALSAKAVLDPLPRFSPVDSTDVGKKLQAFLKATKKLEALWRLIEAEDLSQVRAIICTQPNPALIRAAGLWLERHATAPAIFFRFTNTFELAAKGAATDLLLFSRLAGTHLNTRRGQQRLYFLVNGVEMAHSVMRRCNRRAFVVPMPKHYGEVQAGSSLQRHPPSVYIHMNSRSGPLIGHVGELIRHVKSAHPQAKFVLKFTKARRNTIRYGAAV